MPRGRPKGSGIDRRWTFPELEAAVTVVANTYQQSVSSFLKNHVGVHAYRNWCRWKQWGYVPFAAADHLVHDVLNLHMGEIWPAEYWRTDNHDDMEAA